MMKLTKEKVTEVTEEMVKEMIECNSVEFFKWLRGLPEYCIRMKDGQNEIIWEKNYGQEPKYWAYSEVESELRECSPLVFWNKFKSEIPYSYGYCEIPINNEPFEWLGIEWEIEEQCVSGSNYNNSILEEEENRYYKELEKEAELEEIWKEYEEWGYGEEW